ncbi:MAG: DUF1244 domain-containing protein [Thioalkalivibrio sp.]|nr:MAG: DUF1244 domain-containing protein [Thioalkalivibrio sp.]
MQETTTTRIEAEVFRRLLQHLDERKDVQNIDLMNLAGFCRNCLAKWYVAAAENHGTEVDLDQAREIIYGMPYAQWKRLHQKEATPEQLQSFTGSRTTGDADA